MIGERNNALTGGWNIPPTSKQKHTILTALQAYQPKNPCVICGDDEFVCFEDGERLKTKPKPHSAARYSGFAVDR